MRKRALEGVKVVDFGTVGVIPLTARYLADQGATVIRLESHTRPDPQRVGRPFKDDIPGIDRSGVYAYFNSSKYSATVDLKKTGGKEIGLRLIKWADVVVEGYVPGTLQRLGLDYDNAQKVNPDIIYLSSCLLGHYGPLSASRGFGHQASSMSGFFELTGWPERAPGGLWGAYTDYIVPRFGVASIMAALDYRRREGKGQYISQSHVEIGLQFLAPVIMDYSVNNRIWHRNANRLSYAAPHGAYLCRGNDRWVAIAIFNDQEWQALCKAIGSPPWTEEPKFATLEGRKKHEDELDKLVTEWTNNQTAEEVMKLLQEAGVSAGVVQDSENLFDDPQLAHRDHFRWLEHAVMGLCAYDGPAFRLSKTPDKQQPAPTLGQHNEYIFKELLGMADDEISDLLSERVITTDADLPEFRVGGA